MFKVPGEPDVERFDASLQEDAGPGRLCPSMAPDAFNNAYSPYFGGGQSQDVIVEIVSYFGCPYCAELDEQLKSLFERRPDLDQRVRVYFHHFPLAGHDPQAWEIHAAAWAAGNQGPEYFWALHDHIFAKRRTGKLISVQEAIDFSASLGLDMERFMADLASEEAISFLVWDKEQALSQNVQGTPAVFVCGWFMVNRGELEPALDDLLQTP